MIATIGILAQSEYKMITNKHTRKARRYAQKTHFFVYGLAMRKRCKHTAQNKTPEKGFPLQIQRLYILYTEKIRKYAQNKIVIDAIKTVNNK